MENNNEYEEYTLAELWDLLDAEEARLLSQYEEPINYYIPGDSMTYLSAMSQCWGIEANKDRIEQIETEISRRCKANKSTQTTQQA